MSGIPQRLKVADAITQGQTLTGTLPVAALGRLAAALASPDGEIQVQLTFAAHPVARGRVIGTLNGRLSLVCQRSLEPFEWPLAVHFDWLLVGSEAEEARVMAEADPVMLDGDSLCLRDALEDEALLALPLVPLSPISAPVEGKKPGRKTKGGAMGDNSGLDDSRPNPFAALKGKLPKR